MKVNLLYFKYEYWCLCKNEWRNGANKNRACLVPLPMIEEHGHENIDTHAYYENKKNDSVISR